MDTIKQPGYFELFASHAAVYLQKSATAIIDAWIDRSPKIIQVMAKQNRKHIHDFYNNSSTHIEAQKQLVIQKVLQYEGIKRSGEWASKHALDLLTYSRSLKRALGPYVKDIVKPNVDKDIPAIGSDFGYLFLYDMLPVCLSIASSSILSSLVTSELAASHGHPYLLNTVWMIASVALYLDVVLPYSLRFLSHAIVMGIFYRKQFDIATKDERHIDAKCCDDKCTPLRKVKGEIRDVIGYVLQTLFLLATQAMWLTFGSDKLDKVVQPMLFFLNAFHFGQSTLVMRYASDGVCQRERFESVNHYVKFTSMLGLLQMGAVWLIQNTVTPMQYVPAFMLVNLSYLLTLGLVHYMDVPKPTRVTFKSSILKLIPTNAVYAAVGDDIDRAIDAFKEGCMTPVNTQARKEWVSWRHFQYEIFQFIRKTYYQKLSWPIRKIAECVVNYGGPSLLPELRDQDAFLSDPIFKKYWPEIFVEIDAVLEAIIEYRKSAVIVADTLATIDSIRKQVESTPGLSTVVSIGASVFLGPAKEILSPQLLVKSTEDGLDSVLAGLDQLCKFLKVDSDALTFIKSTREVIKNFRKKRELLFKILEAVGPVSRVIANHLDDSKFLKDIKNIRFYINNIMKNHHVGKFADLETHFSDLTYDADGFYEICREDKERSQLIDEFDSVVAKAKLRRLFTQRDNIILDEYRARDALVFRKHQNEIDVKGANAFEFPSDSSDDDVAGAPPAQAAAASDIQSSDHKVGVRVMSPDLPDRLFSRQPVALAGMKDASDDDASDGFADIDENEAWMLQREARMPSKPSAFSLRFG